MLLAPRLWLRWPPWLGFQGVMKQPKYENPWGLFQIRVLGLIVLATIGWIAYHALLYVLFP